METPPKTPLTAKDIRTLAQGAYDEFHGRSSNYPNWHTLKPAKQEPWIKVSRFLLERFQALS